MHFSYAGSKVDLLPDLTACDRIDKSQQKCCPETGNGESCRHLTPMILFLDA